jgi:hypothetical protein
VLLQHLDGVAREIGFLRAGGQRAVERQVVEGERDLEPGTRLRFRATAKRERRR